MVKHAGKMVKSEQPATPVAIYRDVNAIFSYSIVVAPYLQGERFIMLTLDQAITASHSLSCVLKPISLCWIALVNVVRFLRQVQHETGNWRILNQSNRAG